jgi:hypothetical protein
VVRDEAISGAKGEDLRSGLAEALVLGLLFSARRRAGERCDNAPKEGRQQGGRSCWEPVQEEACSDGLRPRRPSAVLSGRTGLSAIVFGRDVSRSLPLLLRLNSSQDSRWETRLPEPIYGPCPRYGTTLTGVPFGSSVWCPSDSCGYESGSRRLLTTHERESRRRTGGRVALVVLLVGGVVWWGSRPSAEPRIGIDAAEAVVLSGKGWTCGELAPGSWDCFAPSNFKALLP